MQVVALKFPNGCVAMNGLRLSANNNGQIMTLFYFHNRGGNNLLLYATMCSTNPEKFHFSQVILRLKLYCVFSKLCQMEWLFKVPLSQQKSKNPSLHYFSIFLPTCATSFHGWNPSANLDRSIVYLDYWKELLLAFTK